VSAVDGVYFGVDVGGTKIALTAGRADRDAVTIRQKRQFATIAGGPDKNVERIAEILSAYAREYGPPAAVGVSCGGPLDAEKGVILGPPNLPGWDEVPISALLRERLRAPVVLENDADACALAEYRYGAGRGTKNMIFLTFGTGLGAGLILDGRLYRGSTGGAGEAGHIRLAARGPVGYFKAGSFEGFCSGGGLRQLGRTQLRRAAANGTATAWARAQLRSETFSAKDIAEAAYAGDPVALRIMALCGRRLGEGLAILIDVLNPERIVIGSIYARCGDLLERAMRESLEKEALPGNARACEVVPAALGEHVGDYAALCAACCAENAAQALR
jgi:glucokinase